MNRFGLGEKHTPRETEHTNHPSLLTRAHLHYWDKGLRVPADVAARLLRE